MESTLTQIPSMTWELIQQQLKYVEENSITIVFPKKSIVIAKKNLDITNSIMELLNNQLTKIDF